MAIYAVFAVGVGNLGEARKPRRLMVEWLELMNMHLSLGHPSVRIVGFFGHTGNFLADSVSNDLEQVTTRFKGLLSTEWVVLPIEDVVIALAALANVSEPQGEHGVRWTLGLAFHEASAVTWRSLETTPRAVLWTVSPCTIGLWKRDNLNQDGILDRIRRGGGWGAISDDIERQIGGRWTARSCRTVKGLVRKAETAKRSELSTPATH